VPNFTPLNQKSIEDVYQVSSHILGQGSFGEVRLAKHLITSQTRVVKIIYLKDKDEHERKKIIKEIEIMMELDHPNIVKLFEYFLSNKAIFIILEYLSGGELFDKIIQSKNFTENVAKEYMH
jgi:calcium-dependent protein kinase